MKSHVKPPTVDAPTTYAHELFVLVDLLELGFDKEFQLRSDTSRQPHFKHELEIRLRAKNQQQYVYHVHIGDGRALTELRLPKRTIALEAAYKLPAQLPFGAYELSVTSYPDRVNQPDRKAQLLAAGSVTKSDTSGGTLKTTGELRFAHPLIRPLAIRAQTLVQGARLGGAIAAEQKASARVELDIFRTAEQTLVLSAWAGRELDTQTLRTVNTTCGASAKSAGFAVDAQADAHAGASWDRREVSAAFGWNGGKDCGQLAAYVFAGAETGAEAGVRAGDVDAVRVTAKQSADGNCALLVALQPVLVPQAKPLRASVKTTGWRSVQVQVTRPGAFSADAELTWAKVALVQLSDGAGKELLKAQVALDAAHLLAADVQMAKPEELKKFAEDRSKEVRANGEDAWKALGEMADRGKERVKELAEKLRAAAPDVEAAKKAYAETAKKFGEELLADKTLKELYDNL